MKKEHRREQVLETATELFAEKGYHRTTIEDIVKSVGIARGTFYLYFKDKRSIFDELLDNYMTELHSGIIRIDISLGPKECLRLMRLNVQNIVELSFRRRALTKILMSDAVGLDEYFDEKLRTFYDNVAKLLQSSLVLGAQLGVVRPCNTKIVSHCIIGGLKEILLQVTMRNDQTQTEEAINELFQLYWRGLFTVQE